MLSITANLVTRTRVILRVRLLHTSAVVKMPILVRLADVSSVYHVTWIMEGRECVVVFH